jgi:diguanylate cyclase (GGDEF)-like protein
MMRHYRSNRSRAEHRAPDPAAVRLAVLTQLRNRSYFEDDLARLERNGPFPVTVVMADQNGLETVNDELGHAAGEALLRRVGEVLRKIVGDDVNAARLGGDEFGILPPGADERGAAQLAERLGLLIDLDNQFCHGPKLSRAPGVATCAADQRVEDAMSRADAQMYAAKKDYHATAAHGRRR